MQMLLRSAVNVLRVRDNYHRKLRRSILYTRKESLY